MASRWGNSDRLFSWAPKSLQLVAAAMKLKDTCSLEKSYDTPRQHIKKQRHYFTDKGPSSQSYGFSRSHVWMWELDYKESWAPKNLSFQTVVLEKTLENPLDCKEIQPVHCKGNQSWIFIGRTVAEVETPIVWPPDAKSWLIGEAPDAGKDWRQEEKGMTENELVGWHHWLNGHEFDQTLEDEVQGSLVCCCPWGCKELDTTEWLNTNSSMRWLYIMSLNIYKNYENVLLLNVILVSLFSSCSGRNQAVGLSVFPTTYTFSLTNNQATIFIDFIFYNININQVSFITSNTIIYYYLVVNYLYSGLLRGAF